MDKKRNFVCICDEFFVTDFFLGDFGPGTVRLPVTSHSLVLWLLGGICRSEQDARYYILSLIATQTCWHLFFLHCYLYNLIAFQWWASGLVWSLSSLRFRDNFDRPGEFLFQIFVERAPVDRAARTSFHAVVDSARVASCSLSCYGVVLRGRG